MAICIYFQLIEVKDLTAVYQYSGCSDELNGLFEVNMPKYLDLKAANETVLIDEVVRLLPSKYMYPYMVNRVFIKIYKYYLQYNEYPVSGGYYA